MAWKNYIWTSPLTHRHCVTKGRGGKGKWVGNSPLLPSFLILGKARGAVRGRMNGRARWAMAKKPTHYSAPHRFPNLRLAPAVGEETAEWEIAIFITRIKEGIAWWSLSERLCEEEWSSFLLELYRVQYIQQTGYRNRNTKGVCLRGLGELHLDRSWKGRSPLCRPSFPQSCLSLWLQSPSTPVLSSFLHTGGLMRRFASRGG